MNETLPRITFDRESGLIRLQVDGSRMVFGSDVPVAGVYYREDWPPELSGLFDMLMLSAELGITPWWGPGGRRAMRPRAEVASALRSDLIRS